MASDSAPDVRLSRDGQGKDWVHVTGIWNLRSLTPSLGALESKLQAHQSARAWDLSAVAALDHAGALLLWRTWGRRMADPVRLRPEHEMFFAHLAMPDASQLPRQRRQFMGPALVLGGAILNFADHIAGMIALLGHVALDALRLLREPSRVPWREISANLYRTGAQALGITAIVGFLVGIVLSYLSAQQLRTFGADIYIVNLLGISIIRELGPVLAAILVAGRSGSAMTAQIGVMRVTEELDALAVMGIPAHRPSRAAEDDRARDRDAAPHPVDERHRADGRHGLRADTARNRLPSLHLGPARRRCRSRTCGWGSVRVSSSAY